MKISLSKLMMPSSKKMKRPGQEMSEKYAAEEAEDEMSEEEGSEDMASEMEGEAEGESEEMSDMLEEPAAADLEALSDDELLAELKRRGLSAKLK